MRWLCGCGNYRCYQCRAHVLFEECVLICLLWFPLLCTSVNTRGGGDWMCSLQMRRLITVNLICRRGLYPIYVEIKAQCVSAVLWSSVCAWADTSRSVSPYIYFCVQASPQAESFPGTTCVHQTQSIRYWAENNRFCLCRCRQSLSNPLDSNTGNNEKREINKYLLQQEKRGRECSQGQILESSVRQSYLKWAAHLYGQMVRSHRTHGKLPVLLWKQGIVTPMNTWQTAPRCWQRETKWHLQEKLAKLTNTSVSRLFFPPVERILELRGLNVNIDHVWYRGHM